MREDEYRTIDLNRILFAILDKMIDFIFEQIERNFQNLRIRNCIWSGRNRIWLQMQKIVRCFSCLEFNKKLPKQRGGRGGVNFCAWSGGWECQFCRSIRLLKAYSSKFETIMLFINNKGQRSIISLNYAVNYVRKGIVIMLKDFSSSFNSVLFDIITMCSCIINLDASHVFQ